MAGTPDTGSTAVAEAPPADLKVTTTPAPQPPLELPKQLSPEESEAKMWAAYQKVSGQSPATDEPKPDEALKPEARDEKGRFVAATGDTKPSPESPGEKSPAATSKTATEAVADDDKSEKLAAARVALLRDGMEPADIDEFSEEKLLRIGLKASRRQAKGDENWNKLKSRNGATDAPARYDQIGDENDEQARTTAPAADARGDNAIGDVLELLDDDSKGRIEGYVTSVQKSAETATQQAHRAVAESQVKVAQLGLAFATQKLLPEFPFLKDRKGEGFKRVLARMQQLDGDSAEIITSGDPEKVTALMESAIYAEHGKHLRQQAHAQAVKTNREHRQGNPETRDAPLQPPKKTVSPDTFERLAAQAVDEFPHDPVRAAARHKELLGALT